MLRTREALGAVWYESATRGACPMQAMLNNAAPAHRFFVAHEVARPRNFAYASYASAEAFFAATGDVTRAAQCFYEVRNAELHHRGVRLRAQLLKADAPCLPYFDIDFRAADVRPPLDAAAPDEVERAVLCALMHTLDALFRDLFGVHGAAAGAFVTSASRPDVGKFSFHVVLRLVRTQRHVLSICTCALFRWRTATRWCSVTRTTTERRRPRNESEGRRATSGHFASRQAFAAR